MKTAVFLCFFVTVSLLATSSGVQTRPTETGETGSNNWFKLFILKDVNGGTTCATCAVITGLVEQLAEIYNISVADSIEKFCNFLPSGFREGCQLIVKDYAPAVIDLLEKRETPDVVCHAIGLCKNETGEFCHLFPLPKHSSNKEIHLRVANARERALKVSQNAGIIQLDQSLLPRSSDLCNVSIIKPICEIIEKFGDDHLPVEDLDRDNFSDVLTFRGASWRGKDCNDLDDKIYPGRYTEDDALEDTNCNGIYGVDPDSDQTYESLWCKGTQQYGTIILGDSVGAHFHIPPSWLTSKEMSVDAYKDLFFVLENEFDWPMLSSATGYKNSTWPSSITGPVDSSYLRMRDINRCNHRDFQNIAVNGARSSAMAKTIVKSFSRHGKKDQPVFLSLALVGNDVCSGHPDIDHMTKPEDFYTSSLETLKYVDSIVAPGSVVIALGLVDGRILYDTLHDHIHPIGSLRNDVTYANFYDYFNCLQVSPCFGWMNSNETYRNLTTQRAMQLNVALKNLVSTESFENFKVFYFDPPIPKIFQIWKDMGKDVVDLIEPIDGFHSNQNANALNTEVMFDLFKSQGVPLPPRNPHNEKIAERFKDQGGY